MVKFGRSMGILLRRLVTSPTWRAMQDMRNLPTKLMREAGLDDAQKILPETAAELKKQVGLSEMQREVKDLQTDLTAWTTPPTPARPQAPQPEPTSSPPSSDTDNPLTQAR
jgi:hypothetical protein